MQARTAARPAGREAGPEGTGRRPGRTARIVAGAIAVALLLLAAPRPLWEARLTAPQYPDGLTLTAYGNRVEGDLREIEALNHYVGMRPYRPEDLPEMKLWIPTVVAAVLAAAAATWFGRRVWGRMARAFVWAVPLAILADIQLRLYQYGHDLITDPRPALTLEPFTPWVVGRTRVINFTTWAFPGTGVFLVLAAAAVLSFGPGLPRAVRRIARWMGQPVASGRAEPTEPAAEAA